jgi:hypothetical protein
VVSDNSVHKIWAIKYSKIISNFCYGKFLKCKYNMVNLLSITPRRPIGIPYIHIFLTSALVGGEWSTSRHGTHWIGGWVGPRIGLDNVKNRKSLTFRNSNSDSSTFQPVASRYTDCAIPALQYNMLAA